MLTLLLQLLNKFADGHYAVAKVTGEWLRLHTT